MLYAPIGIPQPLDFWKPIEVYQSYNEFQLLYPTKHSYTHIDAIIHCISGNSNWPWLVVLVLRRSLSWCAPSSLRPVCGMSMALCHP